MKNHFDKYEKFPGNKAERLTENGALFRRTKAVECELEMLPKHIIHKICKPISIAVKKKINRIIEKSIRKETVKKVFLGQLSNNPLGGRGT